MLVEDNLKFNLDPTTVDGRGEHLEPMVEWLGERAGTLVAGGIGYAWGDGGPKAALVYTSTDGEHWTEEARPFTSQHDLSSWADRGGSDHSTHDESHYAVVRGDGQVAVWQAQGG